MRLSALTHPGAFTCLAAALCAATLGCHRVYEYRLSLQLAAPDQGNPQVARCLEQRLKFMKIGPFSLERSAADPGVIEVRMMRQNSAKLESIRMALTTAGAYEQRLAIEEEKGHPARFATREEGLAHFKGTLPEDQDLLEERLATPPQGDASLKWRLVEKTRYVGPKDVDRATCTKDVTRNAYDVNFTLTPEGAASFHRLTAIASERNRQIAVIVDNRIQSLLWCKAPISGNAVRVTGSFRPEEALRMAAYLNCGPLPCPVKVIAEGPL